MIFKSHKLEYEAEHGKVPKKWVYFNLAIKILTGCAIAFIAFLLYKSSTLFM